MIEKLWRILRNEGFMVACSKTFTKLRRLLRNIIYKLFFRHFMEARLKHLIHEKTNKGIIIFYPYVPWNMKLKQRPQHIAKSFADAGYLYIYCLQYPDEASYGLQKISRNLYVSDQYDRVRKICGNYILHVYANSGFRFEEFQACKAENIRILYEYVDDLSPELGDYTTVRKRHQLALTDPETILVATADRLRDEGVRVRKSEKNVCLSTNGVNPSDFQSKKRHERPPSAIREVLRHGKPIIGYYGALGSWFDAELVIKIAATGKYSIVLIGLPYRRSYESLGFIPHKNIYYLGAVHYSKLPSYSRYFNVATIPFLINDITQATSPVKLFEYMAAGLPIVTTDMPECRKYRSVLIAKNHEDFLKKIEYALQCKNDARYLAQLSHDAIINSWDERIKSILALLEADSR
jgi:teichuronic acid biosynthesis glycosyltransferase TuaH